jgi:2,3-bisphosphoglycerate-dependent phosphoglycerate mutase
LATRLSLPVHVDNDLWERHLSAAPLDDFQRWLEATWRDFDLALPRGESSSVAQARVSQAIGRIARVANGRNVAIASHGNALALFLQSLDATVDFQFWARMTMPDVHVVESKDGQAWSYTRLWQPSS